MNNRGRCLCLAVRAVIDLEHHRAAVLPIDSRMEGHVRHLNGVSTLVDVRAPDNGRSNRIIRNQVRWLISALSSARQDPRGV